MKLLTLTGLLAAALIAPGLNAAQGRGPGMGRGPGFGRGPGMGRGACLGGQPGQAGMVGRRAGMGPGGWWTWVAPQTEEQKALVQKVTDLHAKIRAANLQIATLTTQKAAPQKLAAKQREVTALRAELQTVTQNGEPLIRQMGVPAGYGVCDGSGPKGGPGACANCPNAGMNCASCPNYGVSCPGCGMRGQGAGRGAGVGVGMRLRNGTGPNCPLAK